MLIFVRMFFKGFISLLFLHNAPVVRQFVLQVNLFQSTTHYFFLHQVLHINLVWVWIQPGSVCQYLFCFDLFFLFPFVCGSIYLSTIYRLTNYQKKYTYITYMVSKTQSMQCYFHLHWCYFHLHWCKPDAFFITCSQERAKNVNNAINLLMIQQALMSLS